MPKNFSIQLVIRQTSIRSTTETLRHAQSDKSVAIKNAFICTKQTKATIYNIATVPLRFITRAPYNGGHRTKLMFCYRSSPCVLSSALGSLLSLRRFQRVTPILCQGFTLLTILDNNAFHICKYIISLGVVCQ